VLDVVKRRMPKRWGSRLFRKNTRLKPRIPRMGPQPERARLWGRPRGWAGPVADQRT
jgi:hypothetical protein